MPGLPGVQHPGLQPGHPWQQPQGPGMHPVIPGIPPGNAGLHPGTTNLHDDGRLAAVPRLQAGAMPAHPGIDLIAGTNQVPAQPACAASLQSRAASLPARDPARVAVPARFLARVPARVAVPARVPARARRDAAVPAVPGHASRHVTTRI